ncbi:MAG TPA: hypothetical protein VNL35_07605 [Chloroflexota bacterium]|nr:hypothetical protein [Chloroflexota bacterium]
MQTIAAIRESVPEPRERLFAEGVPVNGTDCRADRRTHMRELTTARQAAERRLRYPPIPAGSPERKALMAVRVAEVRAALAHINAEHADWLRAHGERL